jgi:hypothetical protein
MGSSVNRVLAGFLLLIFSGVFAGPASAQGEIDAKMKQLEELEARIDAKLKRLENLEARLESRLETGVQPIAARPQGPLAAPANGSATHLPSTVAGAMAPQTNQLWGGQVSFRGGYTHLDKSEDGAIFSGSGTGRDGWMVGGALDIPLMREPFFNNTLLGQISMDFSGINGKTSSPLGLNTGNQSLYKIAVSPKYRIDTLGNIRPWIIPIGLSFLVNSPPSDSAAYLTVGGTTGAGVEYVIADRFSLGLALSYNFYSKAQNRANSNHLSVGPYVGINF